MPLPKNDVPSFKYIQEKIGNPIGITLSTPYLLGFQAGWLDYIEELKKDLIPFLDAEEKEATEYHRIAVKELSEQLKHDWEGSEEVASMRAEVNKWTQKKEFIAQIREIVTRKRFT